MSEPSGDNGLPAWIPRIGLSIALLWAAGIVAYFFKNQYVESPQGSGNHIGLWTVFPALFRKYSFGDFSIIFWPLVGGIIAIRLFTVLGRLFLGCFDFYAPAGARWAVALICGLGIMGILLEPLAIFGWLYTPAVWAALVLSILILWRGSYKIQYRVPPSYGIEKDGRVWRRAMREAADERYRKSLIKPEGPSGLAFAWAAIALISAITLLTFYHALLFPVDYWDSLILYHGYARLTFLEHAFPVKVVGQVGIGLGANYPHIYALLGASISSMWGHWSSVYQQLLTPVLGLASTLLVYHTALRLTRYVNFALTATLLFRAIPYGIAYNTWSSDYAVAIALAAAFCYLSLLFIESQLWGYFAALTLITATGTHLNYLMWCFWGLWALVFVLAHLPGRDPRSDDNRRQPLDSDKLTTEPDPEFTLAEPKASFQSAIRSRRLFATLLIGVLLSLPWVARNWIVCGNPVYAFFPGVFGGTNINEEVMKSAEGEWRQNGDGIGVLTEAAYGENSLANRLRASWLYFVAWQSREFWKLAPVFIAFCLPGVLFWLIALVRVRKAGKPLDPIKFGAVPAALLFGLLFYFYVLGDFYLYQIIVVLPAIAIFAAYWPIGISSRGARVLFGILVLSVGVMPGLSASLMGPKLAFRHDPLFAFRNPLLEESVYYRTKYPGAAEMFEYLNRNLKDEKLLTHENRHLLIDPSIQLVHLDEWEVQPLYGVESPTERASRLKEMGINYYLRVPMEKKHQINARLGVEEMIEAGLLRLIHTPPNFDNSIALYRFE